MIIIELIEEHLSSVKFQILKYSFSYLVPNFWYQIMPNLQGFGVLKIE